MLGKTLVLSFALVLGVSCKLKEPKKASQTDGIESYVIGQSLRPERNLTAAEKTVGARVCRDLRSKRNRWEVNRNDLSFNYNVRSRTQCAGSLATYTIAANVDLAGGDLFLQTASRSKFISEILTDNHPGLSDICDDLISGATDVSNTTIVSGSTYQVTFYEISSNHYVLITRFLADTSGVWRAALVDESMVIVAERTNQSSNTGLVYRRAQATQCGSGSGSTYVDQQIR